MQEPLECGCQCEFNDGGLCGTVQMNWYYNDASSCSGHVDSSASLLFGACGRATHRYNEFTIGVTEEGACVPQVDEPLDPPVSWGSEVVVCSEPGLLEGCPDDQLCAPIPNEPFDSFVCVFRSGNYAACPDGYPDGPHLAYESADDQRECEECSCHDVEQACTASVSIYNGLGCQDVNEIESDTLSDSDAACIAVNGSDLGLYSAKVTEHSDRPIPIESCVPASGGGTQGSIFPADPTTICCRD